MEPFTVEEVQRLLAAAREVRNGARWAVALALGLRQGEALALKWTDIDLDNASLRVRATRLRPVYAHGCDDGTCGRAPGYCPHRQQVNDVTGATKSAAGNRVVGLPGELVELLRSHREEQAQERTHAGSLWTNGDWIFATRTGGPLSPNADYHEWKALLNAPVCARPGCTTRHTAATVLLVLGVMERRVMSTMGWSSTSMAARYQHVTDRIRREVASRVDRLLFGDPSGSG